MGEIALIAWRDGRNQLPGLTLRWIVRAVLAALCLLGVGALTRDAEACPDCAIGRQARARLAQENAHLWPALAGIALPVLPPVLISVLALRGRAGKTTQEPS